MSRAAKITMRLIDGAVLRRDGTWMSEECQRGRMLKRFYKLGNSMRRKRNRIFWETFSKSMESTP